MISSSQQDSQTPERVVSPEEKKQEGGLYQNTFRPKTLENYIGQEVLKKHLQVSISSAKIR